MIYLQYFETKTRVSIVNFTRNSNLSVTTAVEQSKVIFLSFHLKVGFPKLTYLIIKNKIQDLEFSSL